MDKIEEFLLNYSAKKTKQTYKSFLKRFFNVIDSNPNNYIDEKRDYESDVKKFWQNLQDKPPKTIYTAMTVIRVFLSENNIELPSKLWRNIRNRTKGSRAVTEENIPSNLQIKKILNHADVKARALFLTLSSSGMRIGEACQIKTKDVDFNNTPTKIHIRAEYTKSGNRRICFISQEATESVKAWLKHRDQYLKTACNRSKAFEQYHQRKETKKQQDNRLFPFSPGTAREIWNKLLDKADFGDIDERTKVHKTHLHTLRKYFRTRMSLKVPLDVVEALMGHEGYLTEAYRKYSPEQLGELYIQGMTEISIYEAPADLSDVQEQLNEKDNLIQIQQGQIDKLLQAQKAMELKMDIIENRLELEKLKNGNK